MFFKTKEMKKVINENKKLRDEINENEDSLSSLHLAKRNLQNKLEELKLKRKIEEEDLKHLIKIREEKSEIEFTKKEIALEAKHQTALHNEANKYRDKVEKFLTENVEKSERMYTELMGRLPDVNVRLRGDV